MFHNINKTPPFENTLFSRLAKSQSLTSAARKGKQEESVATMNRRNFLGTFIKV